MDKLLDIINEIRDGKGEAELEFITKEMTLREDLDFDSFDLALLTAKLEDVFDVDVFEDGLVSTIGEVVEKLEQ